VAHGQGETEQDYRAHDGGARVHRQGRYRGPDGGDHAAGTPTDPLTSRPVANRLVANRPVASRPAARSTAPRGGGLSAGGPVRTGGVVGTGSPGKAGDGR
jgi:hypothetical protein